MKTAILAAALSAVALARPHAHEPLSRRSAQGVIDCGTDPSGCPRNGPSGSVVYPYGGTEIQQTTNGGDGLLLLNYTTVFDTTTFTQSINVTLVQNPGGNTRYHLASLGALYAGGPIVANLALPGSACGTFNLYIEEQQYTELSPIGSGGGEIKFLAAAPVVQIDCTQFEQAPPTDIVYTATSTTTITAQTTSILTGVEYNTSLASGSGSASQSILTGVTRSSQSILTGVTQSSDSDSSSETAAPSSSS